MSSGIDKKRVKADDIACEVRCDMCLFGGENEEKRGKSQNKRKFHKEGRAGVTFRGFKP